MIKKSMNLGCVICIFILLIGMGAASIEGAEMGSCSGNAIYNFKPVVNPPIVATSNKRHSIEENSKYS